MENNDLNIDFPSEKEWLALCSSKEKRAFIAGAMLYEMETDEGKRVFTLRAARKYTLDGLYNIQHYMIISDKVDILTAGKAAISFHNILKAITEHYPPPTKEDREDTKRSLIEFKKAHPEFFGVIDDDT